MQIEYKKLELQEVEAFFELYKEIVSTDFPDWDAQSKKEWIENDYSISFWEDAIKNEYPIIIATDNGRLVGYVAIEALTFGVAYLGWIGVLKEYRGKDIASKLITALTAECKKKKLHKIELETQLPELLPFFIKNKFEMEGVRRNSWQGLDNYMFGMTL